MLRIRVKGGADPALPIDVSAETVSSNFYELPHCPTPSTQTRLRVGVLDREEALQKETRQEAVENVLDSEEDDEDDDALSTLALDELMNEPAQDEDLVHAMDLLIQDPDIDINVDNSFSYGLMSLGQTPVPIHQSRSAMQQTKMEMSSKSFLTSAILPSTQTFCKTFPLDLRDDIQYDTKVWNF